MITFCTYEYQQNIHHDWSDQSMIMIGPINDDGDVDGSNDGDYENDDDNNDDEDEVDS